MKKHRKFNKRGALIVWDLKINGDVNENYEGGNAARTVYERIVATPQGAKGFSDIREFGTALKSLADRGDVKRIAKTRRTYNIRLTTNDDHLPPNPYMSKDLVPYTPDNTPTLLGEIRDWPLSKRALLLTELSASIAEDMHAFKTVVSEGL